jgi:Flp pilus assembly protein TadG
MRKILSIRFTRLKDALFSLLSPIIKEYSVMKSAETASPARNARRLSARWAWLFARLATDERGVTAVIFSILFSALFFVIAVSLDFMGATREQQRQQSAIDAAALAGSHYLGLENEDTEGPEAARRFFQENMGAGSTAEIEVSLDGAEGKLEARADNKYLTKLMKAILPVQLRKEAVDIGVRSKVVKGDRVEVAMALDNSGSMSGTKIAALKQAAKDAIGILFSGAEMAEDVKVGLVPFAASVNVGTSFRGSNWLYSGPEENVAFPLFAGVATKSRFDVLDDMSQSWAGCVEARQAPYDTNDTVVDASNVGTMFLPMFAPDEPDDGNAVNAGYGTGDYPNNYISDYAGSCPAPEQVCIAWRTRNGSRTCRTYGPAPMAVADAQKRVCKYQNASPSSFEGSASGPNQSCTTPAITPLTSDRTTLDTRIDNLVANGNTNISEGTAWAWRVLSPTAPFTEGRSYTDRSSKKILIVMTDGDNMFQARSNHNASVYAAYGYGSQDRLSAAHTAADFNAGLNSKTLSVCSNAKRAGIVVYTVAFGTEISTTGLELLQDCATSQRHAYIASDETALINTFQNMAREISRLRVAM